MNWKINHLFVLTLMFLSIGMLSSCLKNKLGVSGEEDVVFTAYDFDADFASYKTYILVDTIGRVDLADTGSSDSIVSEPYRTIILNQIDINLLAYGYTKVSTLDSADVIINANVLINPSGDLVSQYSYVDENGEYQSDWWQNEHYYGAPISWGLIATPLYQYQIPNYFTANSGTLIIEVLDYGSLDTLNEKIFVPWIGGIRSILSGENIEQRLVGSINQCFTQSSYLKK